MNVSPRKIITLREARGWHQAEFARQCGLSRAYVSLVELGQRNPSPPAVRAMADALDVPIETLNLPEFVRCPHCHATFELDVFH